MKLHPIDFHYIDKNRNVFCRRTKVNAGLERVNISKPELGMLEKENIQNLKFFGPLQLQTTCDG